MPAGAALAVDRERFADIITQTLNDHPLITVVREVLSIPASSDAEPVIVATGPLTSDALSADLAAVVNRDTLFLRRHQPDRARRVHRPVEGPPVALGQEPAASALAGPFPGPRPRGGVRLQAGPPLMTMGRATI